MDSNSDINRLHFAYILVPSSCMLNHIFYLICYNFDFEKRLKWAKRKSAEKHSVCQFINVDKLQGGNVN